MNNRTISHRQLLTVVLLALFTLGTEVLFSRLDSAGAAGWLCPLVAGAAAMGVAAVVKPVPREEGSRFLWGALLLWGAFFGGAQVCRVGVRLSDSLGASPAFMSAILLILAAWMAAGGLPAFARACEIFLLAVASAFGLILLAGIFRLRWDWVILWSVEELSRVPLGSLETLGLLSIGCYGLLLLEDLADREKRRGSAFRMIVRLSLALAGAGVLILGRFGSELTAQIHRPFFQMVSGLGLEGAFQRLEQLVSALWVLGDLALLGFLLLCLVRLAARVTGGQERHGWAWLWGAVLFLLALPVSFWQGVLDGPVLWIGNLAAGGLILAIFGLKKKK